MTNYEGNPNDEVRREAQAGVRFFVIPGSALARHSSFLIRHSAHVCPR
jgi:hypothetical protein